MTWTIHWLPAICLLIPCTQAQPGESAGEPIEPVPFTRVRFTDDFWAARLETNRTVTIPHVFRKCEEEGRLANFAVAGGLEEGSQRGAYPFDDTDVYKTIEGASYALMLERDPDLEQYLDQVIARIAAAQEDDGYLYTARTNGSRRLANWIGDQRYANLSRSHELYNAGHLFEAAAAHFQATGKRTLLDVALAFADLIDHDFGPDAIQAPPGHQVIELGLVKLFRVTGERRYLDLARFFLDVRGRPLDGRTLGGEYNQDHRPVVEQEHAVGHAVRAAYMYASMAEVAALTGDQSYARAADRLWEDVAGTKLYLTGGIGATGSGEAFGPSYDLPNLSAYNETCAAIGNVYWNQQMFLLHGEGRYIDVLERTLYNGLLSGIALDGAHFFYPNPLASVGQHQRTPWFQCACCTGNVTRFIASVAGYAYAVRGAEIFVNLFAGGTAELDTAAGPVRLTQETRYPWDGRIDIRVEPEQAGEFVLNLRIPGWAREEPVPGDLYRFARKSEQQPALTLNGEPVQLAVTKGYARLERTFEPGDRLRLNLPMPVRRVLANEQVEADRGRVALQRGPVVYCVEWPDVPGGHIRNLLLPDGARLATSFRPDLFQDAEDAEGASDASGAWGVQVIEGQARSYRLDEAGQATSSEVPFTAIPYYAWAHRGAGAMAVWLARDESAVQPIGLPSLASSARVTASFGPHPTAVNDQLEPKSSIDHEVPFFHWWPHKGTTEWIEYDFGEPREISTVEVYWFDDTGIGQCRLPASWRVLALDGEEWKPVHTEAPYGVEPDTFNRVVFETVRTRKVRLEMKSQTGWAGGIHEWRVK